jgi:hypothetical protein
MELGAAPCLLGGSRHPEEAEAMGEHTKLEALDMSIDPRECVLYYFRDAHTISPHVYL